MPTDTNVITLRTDSGLRGGPPPATPRRRTWLVAGAIATAIAIAAGAAWYLTPAGPTLSAGHPEMLRLGFSPGSSYAYRVDANTTTTAEVQGVSRDLSTGIKGTLRIGTETVRAAWAEGHGDLSVLSLVANGAPAPDAFRVRHPMRLHVRGPVTRGMSFETKQGLPLLLLPMLTPVLPARLVVPGDVWSEESAFWEEELGGEAEAFTEFVGFEQGAGVRYAVVRGSISLALPESSELGWGEMSAEVTARIDPEGRRLIASTGTVHFDLRIAAPSSFPVNRMHVFGDSSFTLSPLS